VRQTTLDEFMFVCPYCGKVLKNRAGYNTHVPACKEMPVAEKARILLRRELSRMAYESIMLKEELRRLEKLQKEQEEQKKSLLYIS
jgi:uncharacterized C2H2 Zn-finger protein